MNGSNNKTVVLGVTGGIAAYKAVDIVSRLKKAGVDVYVIMTRHAAQFVAPLTFQSISEHPVAVDMFQPFMTDEIEHIALAKRADLFLIAPATANIIGKIANGIADDMLSTTVMATHAKVVLAPAMNTNMYLNPIVQHNISILKDKGYEVIEPESGRLACGDYGTGRLPSPEVIVQTVIKMLNVKNDLDGKTIMVTAGPTREAIDPVRYISNHSSGKMGYAIARAALDRGAKVLLISGPVALTPPAGAEIIPVISAQDMYEAAVSRFEGVDAVIGAAAPADYKPAEVSPTKIKKAADTMTITLIRTPDIIKTLGQTKTKQKVVGFAAETQDIEQYARQKLVDKNMDMIVANDVSVDGVGFGSDYNAVKIIRHDGNLKEVPRMSKEQVAHIILDELAGLFEVDVT